MRARAWRRGQSLPAVDRRCPPKTCQWCYATYERGTRRRGNFLRSRYCGPACRLAALAEANRERRLRKLSDAEVARLRRMVGMS